MKNFYTTILGLILLGPYAHGQASSLNHSATVEMSCRIAVGPMNFGGYNPLDSSLPQASANLTLICTPGNSVIVKMSGGTNATAYKLAGDSYNYTRCQRAMKSPQGDFVAYDLAWGTSSYDPATSNSSNAVLKDDTCANSYAGNLSGISFKANQPETATYTRQIWGFIRNYSSDRVQRSAFVDGRKARPGSYTDSVVVQVTY